MASLVNSQVKWWYGQSDAGHTWDLNLPPALYAAAVMLWGTGGDGLQLAAIQSYRKRLSDGSDEDIDFGEWPGWVPFVLDFASSFTFSIATGRDQECWALVRVDTWA
jgi:hypothetical protein